MSTKKVIVVGATGNLGNKLAKALIQQGAEVTAMVRLPATEASLKK